MQFIRKNVSKIEAISRTGNIFHIHTDNYNYEKFSMPSRKYERGKLAGRGKDILAKFLCNNLTE